MDNIVIFCKSYSGDIDRVTFLKNSIDKFNVDRIPFYVSCPQKDKPLFETRLCAGDEKYKFKIVTDEEILSIEDNFKQSWHSQQIIKLSFYKLEICNFYISIDSDCYFIKEFYISDFMFDETTPYSIMKVARNEERFSCNLKQKEFFKRHGISYDWISVPIVLSCYVLRKLNEYLVERMAFDNKTAMGGEGVFQYLIAISPFEYSWYGEFLYFLKPFQIIPIDSFFEVLLTEQMYQQYRKRNDIQDILDKRYIGICMQQGWVHDKIYKPSKFISFYKLYDKIYHKWHSREFSLKDFLKGLIKKLIKKNWLYSAFKRYSHKTNL